jgi:hypothetical protein
MGIYFSKFVNKDNGVFGEYAIYFNKNVKINGTIDLEDMARPL